MIKISWTCYSTKVFRHSQIQKPYDTYQQNGTETLGIETQDPELGPWGGTLGWDPGVRDGMRA